MFFIFLISTCYILFESLNLNRLRSAVMKDILFNYFKLCSLVILKS